MESNKGKSFIIGALVIAVMVMAVGYAALAANLQINGTATITSSWNVHWDTTKTSGTGVIDVTPGVTGTGGQTPTGTITYTDNLHANISADLKQPGDRVVFTLTIQNEGSITAALANSVVTAGATTSCTENICTSTNGNIRFTVGNPSTSPIAQNETATVQVTAEFVSSATTTIANETANITVVVAATQAGA